MTTTSHLITADELLASPQQHQHCELVKGELVQMSPTGMQHGELTLTISFLLTSYIRKHSLGTCVAAETGFILSRNPDTVRAPDFAYIPKDRLPPDGVSTKFGTVIPALVVEVLSPSDLAVDVAEKTEEWLRFGVDQVWIVNPKLQSITVHAPNRDPHIVRHGETIDNNPLFPGMSLAIADLFST